MYTVPAKKARQYGFTAIDKQRLGTKCVIYEAAARAEALTDSEAKVREYIALARGLAVQVSEKDDRDSLLRDLDSI